MFYALIPSFEALWEEIRPSEGKTEIKDRIFFFPEVKLHLKQMSADRQSQRIK